MQKKNISTLLEHNKTSQTSHVVVSHSFYISTDLYYDVTFLNLPSQQWQQISYKKTKTVQEVHRVSAD